jgi:hypothetical protein
VALHEASASSAADSPPGARRCKWNASRRERMKTSMRVAIRLHHIRIRCFVAPEADAPFSAAHCPVVTARPVQPVVAAPQTHTRANARSPVQLCVAPRCLPSRPLQHKQPNPWPWQREIVWPQAVLRWRNAKRKECGGRLALVPGAGIGCIRTVHTLQSWSDERILLRHLTDRRAAARATA